MARFARSRRLGVGRLTCATLTVLLSGCAGAGKARLAGYDGGVFLYGEQLKPLLLAASPSTKEAVIQEVRRFPRLYRAMVHTPDVLRELDPDVWAELAPHLDDGRDPDIPQVYSAAEIERARHAAGLIPTPLPRGSWYVAPGPSHPDGPAPKNLLKLTGLRERHFQIDENVANLVSHPYLSRGLPPEIERVVAIEGERIRRMFLQTGPRHQREIAQLQFVVGLPCHLGGSIRCGRSGAGACLCGESAACRRGANGTCDPVSVSGVQGRLWAFRDTSRVYISPNLVSALFLLAAGRNGYLLAAALEEDLKTPLERLNEAARHSPLTDFEWPERRDPRDIHAPRAGVHNRPDDWIVLHSRIMAEFQRSVGLFLAHEIAHIEFGLARPRDLELQCDWRAREVAGLVYGEVSTRGMRVLLTEAARQFKLDSYWRIEQDFTEEDMRDLEVRGRVLSEPLAPRPERQSRLGAVRPRMAMHDLGSDFAAECDERPPAMKTCAGRNRYGGRNQRGRVRLQRGGQPCRPTGAGAAPPRRSHDRSDSELPPSEAHKFLGVLRAALRTLTMLRQLLQVVSTDQANLQS